MVCVGPQLAVGMHDEAVQRSDPAPLDLANPALPSCCEAGDGDAVPIGGANKAPFTAAGT
eukprot:671151-Pyramimonas_sp.AAC.1